VVPAVLGAVLALPFMFLLGAYLWQMLPKTFVLRMQKYRALFIAPFIFLGVGLATAIGPPLEAWLFGGEIKAWLNGLHADPKVGNPLGGWVILLTPLMGVLVAILMAMRISPWIRQRSEGLSRRGLTVVDFVKFLGGVVLTLALVLGVGQTLTWLGFDIRAPLPLIGSFMETYDQRNCLVVGVIMGFAIIPIIYTISEDALSTVPEHLRSASLGAGATPWQTAVRIIIPTAMSGLFSALMIGLGRAVGETMIVLMALGNTPVMDMNIFEGARTLSANIAVELPEAAQGGTHYRVLFLAALTLFAMTFVVNTVAELVRLRFRKRAYQL
jgi:phosphate transport system permease protein